MKTTPTPRSKYWTVLALTAALGTGVLIPACNDRPNPPAGKKLTTPETLVGDYRKDEYKNNPSPENARKMDHALAELDSEIQELKEITAKTSGSERARAEEKLVLLQRKRDELAKEYNEAKYRAAVDEAKQAIKDFGQAVKDAVTPNP